jgi:acyl dehydratase
VKTHCTDYCGETPAALARAVCRSEARSPRPAAGGLDAAAAVRDASERTGEEEEEEEVVVGSSCARGEAPPERQRMPQKSSVNFAMVVDGERRITFHKPLPPKCEVVSDERYVDILDKGEGKGAVLIQERVSRDKASGDKLFTIVTSIFARGDGGFGGKPQGAGPALHEIPDRAPDLVHECDTRPDQAFLYALSGDRNPLHRDPAFAKMVGFPRPILHGLCSYGTACRAVLETVAQHQPERITQFDVRFSKPVFPGETLVVELWQDGQTISYRASVKERPGTVVLNNGLCQLA